MCFFSAGGQRGWLLRRICASDRAALILIQPWTPSSPADRRGGHARKILRSCSQHAWSTCLTPERSKLVDDHLLELYTRSRSFFSLTLFARTNRSNTPCGWCRARRPVRLFLAGSRRCAPGLRPRAASRWVRASTVRCVPFKRRNASTTCGTSRVLTDRSVTWNATTTPFLSIHPSPSKRSSIARKARARRRSASR